MIQIGNQNISRVQTHNLYNPPKILTQTCLQHNLPITHICIKNKCHHIFNCSSCFLQNSKHIFDHKQYIQNIDWINSKFQIIFGTQCCQLISKLRTSYLQLIQKIPKSKQKLKNQINQQVTIAKQQFDKLINKVSQEFLDQLEKQSTDMLQNVKKVLKRTMIIEQKIYAQNKIIGQSYKQFVGEKIQNNNALFIKNLGIKIREETNKFQIYQSQLIIFKKQLSQFNSDIQNNFFLNIQNINKSFQILQIKHFLDKSMPKNFFIQEINDNKSSIQNNLYLIKYSPIPHIPISIQYLPQQSNTYPVIKVIDKINTTVYGITDSYNLFIKEKEQRFGRIQEKGHNKFQVKVKGKRYYASQKKGYLKMIQDNQQNCQAIKQVKVTKQRISFLNYNEEKDVLVVGSSNGSFSFWNLNLQLFEKYNNVHKSKIVYIFIERQKIISCSIDGQINMISIQKKQLINSCYHQLKYKQRRQIIKCGVNINKLNQILLIICSNDDKRLAFINVNK